MTSLELDNRIHNLAKEIYYLTKHNKLNLDEIKTKFIQQYSFDEIVLACYIAVNTNNHLHYYYSLIIFIIVFIVVNMIKINQVFYLQIIYTLVFGGFLYCISIVAYKKNFKNNIINGIIDCWFGTKKIDFNKNLSLVDQPNYFQTKLHNYRNQQIIIGKYSFYYYSQIDGEKNHTQENFMSIKSESKYPRTLIYDYYFKHNWIKGEKIRLESNSFHKKLFVLTDKFQGRDVLQLLQPNLIEFLTNWYEAGIFDAIEINNEQIFVSYPDLQTVINLKFKDKLLFPDTEALFGLKKEIEQRYNFIVDLKGIIEKKRYE